jgi:pilus assembly protein Flp/PilA
MSSLVSRLLRDQDGVTAIEYALIASLISIAAVDMMTIIGTNVTKTFSTVASAF